MERPARLLHDPSECLVCSGEILSGGISGEEDAGLALAWATAHQPLTLYWNLSTMLATPMRRTCAANYIDPSRYTDRLDEPQILPPPSNWRTPGVQLHDRHDQDYYTDPAIDIRHRCSCLWDLRRREPNSLPTIPQAYKHFAQMLCMQCGYLDPGHKGEHKLKCLRFDCTLKLGHEGSHSMLNKFRWCELLDCTRELGHAEPHRMAQQLPSDSWDYPLNMGHFRRMDSRALTARLSLLTRKGSRRLEQLNSKVLEAMTGSEALNKHPGSAGMQANLKPQKKFESGGDAILSRKFDALSLYNPQRLTASSPYGRLDQASNQIRLFKLEPCHAGNKITGSFLHACIEDCPYYTALSYAWGDVVDAGTIRVGLHDNSGINLAVADNLLCFLRVQSRMITEPKLFWIDAICINQKDLHERNHQVGLMKLIYSNAHDVHVWLGREADDSKRAMRFLSRGGPQPLRPRGCGFYPVWTRREARALCELCERPYWRRMWIIQEVIHARRIRVWCGDQVADWTAFDNLYRTLKTLDEMGWSAHHRHAIPVLQSSALTMVWQRAHWRHPNTPMPTLQTLIEVFQEWKCSDLRDKVYALVGLAAAETAVAPDYSLSARQVYFDVIQSDLIHRSSAKKRRYVYVHKSAHTITYELRTKPPPALLKSDLIHRSKFCNLLSQLLGLSKADANLDKQNL